MDRFPPLTARDRRDLRRHGLSSTDAVRQAEFLCRPSLPLRLLRPCLLGDGIDCLSLQDQRRFSARAESWRRAHGFTFFVPASGAATRLFAFLDFARAGARRSGRTLAAFIQASPGKHREAALFFKRLPELALADELDARLRRSGPGLTALLRRNTWDPIVDVILGDGPSVLGDVPKGLLPFHRAARGPVSALEEHLRDAADVGSDGNRLCRIHLTVAPEHHAEFINASRRLLPVLEKELRVHFQLTFSRQKPSTDTLAIDDQNRWVRRSDGRLLFRPGGHGALLENLNLLPGHVVFIRNVDNVGADAFRRKAHPWRMALAGRLLEAEEQSRRLRENLRRGASAAAVHEALGFVLSVLGRRPPRGREVRAWLRGMLERPWRVCGMIRATGEPGGGPFWVAGGEGPSRQIVEAAQISSSPGQQAIWRGSTHFNPVDLVVGLTGSDGRPHRLEKFVDSSAALVSTKVHDGRPIRVLERPGLWNGGMAHWNTVFIEIPSTLFHPVKMATDLFRPGHRPRAKC